MNLPTSHPMHLGFDPLPAVQHADLVIAIECPVPYLPATAGLARAPTMIQIGVDPLFARLPMRSFPVDLALAGDPARTLEALAEVLARKPAPPAWEMRRAKIEKAHDELFARARTEAEHDGARPTISKRYLSHCLGQVLDDDAIVFNEYDLDPTLVRRDEPGTWFENSIASGLGWALGAALGAKLALPERTMVAAVGDGAYLFNTPLSAHHVAAAEGLPILIVIFDDRAWSTIKRSYRAAHPTGAALTDSGTVLCDFPRTIDYAKVAEAAGGVGLRVEKPAELLAALREAMRLVRSGDRHVLVDVMCDRDG